MSSDCDYGAISRLLAFHEIWNVFLREYLIKILKTGEKRGLTSCVCKILTQFRIVLYN
jgi:hypothetical protein